MRVADIYNMKGGRKMSDSISRLARDYSEFDSMSTSQLEEILRKDSYLPEGEESDVDTILYITEVIARREKEQPTCEFTDVDTAWKAFNENYRFPDDGKSIYDFGYDAARTDSNNDEPIPFKQPGSRKPRKIRGILRSAYIIAAFLALIFAGSLSAYAMGYDLWGAMADWTKDTFGFVTNGQGIRAAEGSAAEVPEQLEGLKEMMIANGLPAEMLPSYIPDGYEVQNTQCSLNPRYVNCFVQMIGQNGGGSIIIQYRLWLNEEGGSMYQKDEGDPETYMLNDDTKVYVMTNWGKYKAVWMYGNTECSISGVLSRDEMYNIIDSIGG